MSRRQAMIIVLAGAITAACGKTESPRAADAESVGTSGHAAAATVESVVSGAPPAFVVPDREGTRLWDLTKQFYAKRGNATAWIDDRKPSPRMDALVNALQQAGRDGVDPELYSV